MRKKGARRLLKLAKFLRKVPEEAFDMADWYTVPGMYEDDDRVLDSSETYISGIEASDSMPEAEELIATLEQVIETHKSCDTAACALGYAVICFPKRMSIVGDGSGDYTPVFTTKHGIEYVGFGAAERFFDLIVQETQIIFSRHEYGYSCGKISPSQVADRIEEMVKDYHPELV